MQLQQHVTTCSRCPRLVAHCRKIAIEKRRAYLEWTYWGKPVPAWGDPAAELLLVGLAPGAHGANRTGRMFTGDRSGDFLYRALWETGFASQPFSTHREDGLQLHNVWMTAAARCAPPDNRPQPDELSNCFPFLGQEFALLPSLRLVVALGGIAASAYLKLLRQRGEVKSLAQFPFGHGRFHSFRDAPPLLCCYHPSQQNTSTGRLTAAMLRDLFSQAASYLADPGFPHPAHPQSHLDE
ncbi:MAG: uracil-DNA glycosylase [Bryobacterales bacterium]|nr:uracil-DNA glycosylase [Bryobacterales bacterium]